MDISFGQNLHKTHRIWADHLTFPSVKKWEEAKCKSRKVEKIKCGLYRSLHATNSDYQTCASLEADLSYGIRITRAKRFASDANDDHWHRAAAGGRCGL